MRVTYEFYLDVFWVTNLMMDGAILALTGLLGRERIPVLRILLASAFGATASACLFLWLSSYTGYQLILHVLVNPIMILIGFSWKGIWMFLRRFLGAYVIAVVLGGVLAWIWPAPKGNFWLYAGAAGICCGAGILALHFKKRRIQVLEVVLVAEGEKISAKGFWDTGNLLWDPMLKRPVHIIQRELLPERLRMGQGVHYIPYQSLGQEKGLLPAVVIEGMYVRENAGDGGKVRYIEKPVLGLAQRTLFAQKPYQMILHGTVME